MKPLYSLTQLRELEQQYATAGLMEKAGLAAAQFVRKLLRGHEYAVLVLAGPGNNGGDALVAARHLKSSWHQVTVVFTGDRAKLPPDAAAAYDAWVEGGGELLSALPARGNWQLVVDGLFGIGLSRQLDQRHQELIQQVNQLALTVLALDIPSGLCMHSGQVLGAAIRARHTLTFLALKPGLYTLDGPDHAGEVHLEVLQLSHLADNADSQTNLQALACTCGSSAALEHAAPAHAQILQADGQRVAEQAQAELQTEIAAEIPLPTQGWLVDEPPVLPPARRLNSHKGSHGSVGVIGGADYMVGAALLAGRAALLAGAGRIYIGLLAQGAPAHDAAQPELMLRQADQVAEFAQVLVLGPGMGASPVAKALLQQALGLPQLLVLDADALNLLAADADLQPLLRQRQPGATVITPHPGEAASLLGMDTAAVQADRIGHALLLAQRFNATALLKGCGSVVAMADGRWFINRSGNPGLASAGMGDTLCGIVAALAAQGMALEHALLLAVYLHGAAADALVAQGKGPIGLSASEVAHAARDLLNDWAGKPRWGRLRHDGR